jgi:uncharacterized membrane protein
MITTSTLVIHIATGSIALVSGLAAFIYKKGSPNHKLAGKVFLYTMLIMALSGFYLALLRDVHITMLASGLTSYLVLSSWLAVKRPSANLKWMELATFVYGGVVTAYAAFLSYQGANGITDSLGSYIVPAGVYYFFTAILSCAFVMDIRRYVIGELSMKQKVLRHLWRMCVAMYFATSSFFGQVQIFPEVVVKSGILSLPELMVFLTMVFWLIKTAWPKFGFGLLKGKKS